MKYMVVEQFKPGARARIYERFASHGRMLPGGLQHIASWVAEDRTRCYQLMQCEDRASFDSWVERWADLVDFEIVPVISTEEAARTDS